MTTNRRVTAQVPATRIVYYPDPTITDPHAELVRYTAREIAARRAQDQVLYARWVQRQALIAERDRRNRRFLIIAGLTGLAIVLGFLGVAGWLVYRAITTAATLDGTGLLGLALGAVVLAGAVGVGHRCITVIEHRH